MSEKSNEEMAQELTNEWLADTVGYFRDEERIIAVLNDDIKKALDSKDAIISEREARIKELEEALDNLIFYVLNNVSWSDLLTQVEKAKQALKGVEG